MNNIIKTFTSPMGDSLRVFVRDGEPWFVGKEVATALGYKNTNKAINAHVDTSDKRGYRIVTPLGGPQETTLINESGLYSLILSSKLPQAQTFKHWVTSEVLPQIRKTGGYIPLNEDDDEKTILAKAVVILQRTLEQKDELIAQQRPKVIFHDAVQGSINSCGISELAKMISQNGVETGQKRLFQWMRDKGYLGTVGEYYNLPTQRAMERGLFEVKEFVYSDSNGRLVTRRSPKVTGKGQTYFINLFVRG